MQLSKHFSLAEATRSTTAQSAKIANTPDATQLAAMTAAALGMEQVRALLGHKSITPTSWFRSRRVNALVGGTATSDHVGGWAVDFSPPEGWTLLGAAKAIRDSGLVFDQLIMETSRGIIHLSFDPKQRRQVGEQRLGAGTPIVWRLPS